MEDNDILSIDFNILWAVSCSDVISPSGTGIEHACCFCCLGDMLLQLLESVTEARKLEVESGYQWKQTKHLLKYIKNQEREIARTERSAEVRGGRGQ